MATITVKLADFAASLNSISYTSNDGGLTNFSTINFEANTVLNFSSANVNIITTNIVTSNVINSDIITSNNIINSANISTDNVSSNVITSNNITNSANISTGNINYTGSITRNRVPAFLLRAVRYFTSGTSATFTPTTGVRALYVEVIGAGGGGGSANGGGASTAAIGFCGGGGGYSSQLFTNMNQTFTYTIGAGGTGGAATAPASAGSQGGSSTFIGSVDGTMTAIGGTGGGGHDGTTTNSQSPDAASGGSASGGDLNIRGAPAIGRTVLSGLISSFGSGGYSIKFPVATVSANTNNHGATGQTYGCGGSGGVAQGVTTDRTGGDGADGIIIITEYY